ERIDPARRVVRRGDAAGDPVLEPAHIAELRGNGPRAGPRLPFELEQAQFGNAPLHPDVGREAHLGDDLACQVKRQTLDGPGAEAPAGDDRFGLERADGHGEAKGSTSDGSRIQARSASKSDAHALACAANLYSVNPLA